MKWNWFLAKTVCIIFGLLICTHGNLFAQDLEKVAKGEILQASGGLQYSQVFYRNNGMVGSRRPFSYVLSGNVNLRLFDFIDAPLLVLLSNAGNTLTQPTFNQTSFHPKYKWIETHFGTISATWSPYVLHGHVFQGAALDLSPGNWKLSGMHGLMRRITPNLGTDNMGTAQSAFNRKGSGCKISWAKSGMNHGFQVFRSYDVDGAEISAAMTAPESNAVVLVNTGFSFAKKWNLRGEQAWSALNADTRVKGQSTYWFFTRTNAATVVYKAAKAGLDYKGKYAGIALNYERIDPGYRTHGAYYFNNDLENVNLGLQGGIWKNRCSYQVQLGKQRDNLDGRKWGIMSRTVANISAQMRFSRKWNCQTNYSNFLSYSNARTGMEDIYNQDPALRRDTLNFRQISRNFMVSTQYVLKQDSAGQHYINLNFTAQNAADWRNNELQSGSLFANGSISTGISRKRHGMYGTVAVNVGRSDMQSMGIWSISPCINMGRTFFKNKVKWSFGCARTLSLDQTGRTSGAFYFRSQCAGSIAEKHQISISAFFMQRQVFRSTIPTSNYGSREQQIALNYALNLNLGRK